MLFKIQRKKVIAVMLAICLSLSILMSWGYIIYESDHSCTQESCQVCIRVDYFIEHITEIGKTVNFGFVTIFLCVLALVLAHTDTENFVTHPTLISLKVRLDI